MLQTMKMLRSLAAAALGSLAYSLAEARMYRLQEHELHPEGPVPPLRILHISDAHLTARDRQRISFMRSLADVPRCDLVLMTGDMIEDDGGIDPLLEVLAGIEGSLGRAYVLGSHDYYQSSMRLPTKYLSSKRRRPDAAPADTDRLQRGLDAQGWIDLTNRSHTVPSEAGDIVLTGVDDPYLERHRTDHLAYEHAAVAIGLTHAPDVVSDFVLHGYDLVLAGHTHGGQLRVPVAGAIVTNSSLPAGLAAGVNRVGACLLHVSPGLGTSRFTRIRFLCRPEATVLHLHTRIRA